MQGEVGETTPPSRSWQLYQDQVLWGFKHQEDVWSEIRLVDVWGNFQLPLLFNCHHPVLGHTLVFSLTFAPP